MSSLRTAAARRARGDLEQAVALGVAEVVVDVLEAVEVAVDDGEVGGITPAEELLEPVVEQGAVGQAGERVGEGAALEVVLDLATGGGVVDVDHQAGHGRVGEQVGGPHLQPAGARPRW